MADMPSHHEGKGADLGRPEDVGVRRRLGPALHDSLMNRAQFVHMVTLVRAGAGVHEREHPGDKERRFVVRDRIGTGKYRAGLAVFALTVAEEERVRGRVVVSEVAGLSHETA